MGRHSLTAGWWILSKFFAHGVLLWDMNMIYKYSLWKVSDNMYACYCFCSNNIAYKICFFKFLQNITWLSVRSKPSFEFNLLNFAPFFMVIPCLFHYRSMAGRGWFKTGSGPSGSVGRAPPCKHMLTNNSAAECSAIKPNRFSLLSLSAIYPPTLLLYQVCGDGWEIGLGLTLISS